MNRFSVAGECLADCHPVGKRPGWLGFRSVLVAQFNFTGLVASLMVFRIKFDGASRPVNNLY